MQCRVDTLPHLGGTTDGKPGRGTRALSPSRDESPKGGEKARFRAARR